MCRIIDAFDEDLTAEIRGIAEGPRSFEDIGALNSRTEIMFKEVRGFSTENAPRGPPPRRRRFPGTP